MSMNSMEDLQAKHTAGDSLSSDEATKLLRWLSDNPHKRHEMLIDESIDSQLHCLARISDHSSAERFISETVQRAIASPQTVDGIEIAPASKTRAPRSFQWFSIPVSICAAVLVLVASAISWYSMQSGNNGDVGFAKVTSANNLSWEWIDVDSRRLRVVSGDGEVQFENGAIAQLSAPAIIELKTAGRMFVKTGSVQINVPPAAVGFTVETPLARIVDFGTQFDVEVGKAGQTETHVRSGTVTFKTHPMGLTQKAPIRLTAGGLNHASAAVSEFQTNIRSITTTANGSHGQFYGAIYANGRTVEFSDRQKYDLFLNLLDSSLEENPSQLIEKWKTTIETTANGASTQVEGSSGSGNAHEMLIEQLRSMQELHPENTQMQQLLEGMIQQTETGHDSNDTSR